jgi:ligand-binding SRPBCC domain-containing protein
MASIRLLTFIKAPPDRVFDLARSIEAHEYSAARSREKAVAGVRHGLIGLNEEVTWEARHFGFKQQLTVRITEYEWPLRFKDVMVAGPFKSMTHEHKFIVHPPGMQMVDRLDFESPLGMLGRVADRFLLFRYMRRFLAHRNRVLRQLAESDGWKKFLTK